MDIYGLAKQLERSCELVERDFCAEDSKRILEFLRLKGLEGLSTARRLKYYAALKVLRRVCPKVVECSRRELEEFLLLLRSEYKTSSQETNWYCVRRFLEWLGKEDLFKGLKPSFKHKGMKLPEELLTREEVERLVAAAHGLREKAMISVLYESGARIGEIVTLQRKHVSFDEYGAVLIVNGKTGMRRVRLVESAPILAEWMDKIEGGADAPVWPKKTGEQLHYRTVYKIMKALVKECSVTKNIYPHLFRHTRATHLADKLTEQQMKIYFGWAGGSDMASVYVHLSGRDVEDAILRLYGIERSTLREGAWQVGAQVA
jgi:integrase/recombinase XerD